MLEKMWAKYRYSWILYREFVRTDFKLRYQDSVLGYLWALLKPIFNFVILYFVFVHFLRIGGDVPHWPAALLAGTMLWGFFSEIVSISLGSVVGKGGLLRKVNFPKYVIILASATSALLNFVFYMIVLFVFCLFVGVEFGWSALAAPVWVFQLFIFAVGLGFLLSTLYVKIRDINYIWEIVSQALFFASAVMWPVSMVAAENGFIARVLLLNPVANALQSFRHDVISPYNQTLHYLSDGALHWNVIPWAIIIIVFTVGVVAFKRSSPRFAENV